MPKHSAEFVRCMESCDVARAFALWSVAFPHLPAPRDDGAMLATLHIARTQSEAIRFPLRAYSHSWLTERGLPSELPDALRPRAERMYPRTVTGVGIAVGTPPHRAELGCAIRGAMEDVVLEHYDRKIEDPVIIKPRMFEARKRILKIS